MKFMRTVHNWYLIILGCVTKVKAYKTLWSTQKCESAVDEG